MAKKNETTTTTRKEKLTPRQELFAIEIANGVNNADAYRVVYGQGNYSDESLYVQASRLRAKVDLRVKEILQARAQSSVEDRKYCNSVLMNIVRTNPKSMMYTDPKTGKMRMRTPAQLADSTSDAVSVMTNDRGKVTYRFHGKLEAIRILAQMNGWNAPEQHEHHVEGNVRRRILIGGFNRRKEE